MRPIELPPLLGARNASFLVGATYMLIPLFLGVDRWIARAMTDLDRGMVDFFQAITFLGRSPGYLVIATGIAIWCGLRARELERGSLERFRARSRAEAAVFVFATVAIAGIATNLVKLAIGRLRPSMFFDAGLYGFAPFNFESTMRSFPSGHATTAFALALALGALWPRHRRWLAAAACLVAASRVAINAHYFGDVVGGALVAILTMVVVRRFFAAKGWAFGVEDGSYRHPSGAGR
jgi:undecaprenyl-diphosphatase